MHRSFPGALALSYALFWWTPGLAAAPRVVAPLDTGWRLHLGDAPGAEAVDFDDSSWTPIDTPHDWSIEGPFEADAPARGEGAFLPTGVAWSRLVLERPPVEDGRRVFVEFDGVMAHSDVWLCGRRLGRRPSGYVSFRYDGTEALAASAGPAVLAVRSDTSDQVASRWYTGGGIYRHARMVLLDPLHIEHEGVFVTTHEVGLASARVECCIEVRNDSGKHQEYSVEVELIGPSGDVVAQGTSAGAVDHAAVATASVFLRIEKPRLWDVDHPALHRCVARLVSGGRVLDEVATSFGVRSAEFRADTGFWLNGRNRKLKGVCLHHDGGAVGAAVPRAIWEFRLGRLKELGVNAVRTAHNPPDPVLLDACDRLGLLVMDELFDCWMVGKRPYDYHRDFEEWSKRDLRDTIRRDRNHPSVILYSVGNEIHDTARPVQAKRILRGLVDACHQTDPTRPVTQALFRPNSTGDFKNGLADMLDVIGVNYRDQELLEAWREQPTRKIIGTEQGHERGTWLACRDNPQHAGQFLWVGVDYLGESRRWPVTTFDSGLLDRTGAPHPRGYERGSWWSERPMVRAFRREAPTEATPADPGYEEVEWRRRRVLMDDWSPRDTDPHRELVEVYSNCESVELVLDNRPLGAKSLPDDARPRQWVVPYAPGELAAVGLDGGREVARHVLRTPGPPTKIELSTNRDRLTHEWDDVAVVEARIVDAQGVPLPREARRIRFRIGGPGAVIAVDNGSIVSHEPFRASERTTHLGRCVAIVGSTAPGGRITVTAESSGLAPGSVSIATEAASPRP